jgi:DNA-binding MarR family transcriptional regulator
VGSELAEAVLALARGSRVVEHGLGDMSLPQFRVLALIERSPARASALAERAAVSRPSLTGVLDGLEGRGWVRRVEVSGDRRGVSLEVTKEGRAALRSAERAVGEHLAELLDGLPADERAAAVAGLEALGRAISLRAAARVAAER